MSEPRKLCRGSGADWTEERSDEGPPQAARLARRRLKGAPEASGGKQ